MIAVCQVISLNIIYFTSNKKRKKTLVFTLVAVDLEFFRAILSLLNWNAIILHIINWKSSSAPNKKISKFACSLCFFIRFSLNVCLLHIHIEDMEPIYVNFNWCCRCFSIFFFFSCNLIQTISAILFQFILSIREGTRFYCCCCCRLHISICEKKLQNKWIQNKLL